MKKNRLPFVRDFLKDILDNISTHPLRPDKFGHFWYEKEEGYLTLERGEIEKYRSVRDKLLKEFSKKEDLSESALGSALKTAVFECVDLPKQRDKDPDIRLNRAIEKLRKFLNRSPEQYECYIEVGGLDISSLRSNFGDIRFVSFNKYQLEKLRKTISNETRRRFVRKPRGYQHQTQTSLKSPARSREGQRAR